MSGLRWTRFAATALVFVACAGGDGGDVAETHGGGAVGGGNGAGGAGGSSASAGHAAGNPATSGGAATATGCVSAEPVGPPPHVAETGKLFHQVPTGVMVLEGDRPSGVPGGANIWEISSGPAHWVPKPAVVGVAMGGAGLGGEEFVGASWGAVMTPGELVATAFLRVRQLDAEEGGGKAIHGPCPETSQVDSLTAEHLDFAPASCAKGTHAAWRAVLAYGAAKARMYRGGEAKITEYTAAGGAYIPFPYDNVLATEDQVGTRLLAVGRYHVRVGMGRPTAIYDLDTPKLTSVDTLVFPRHGAAAASPSATEVALAGLTTTGFRVVRMQVPAGSFQDIPVGNLELGSPDELIATWRANQLWLFTRTHGDYGVRVLDVDTGALLGRRDDLGPLFGLVDPVVPLNGFSPKELLTAVSAPDGTVMAAHQIGPWAAVALRWSPSCGP